MGRALPIVILLISPLSGFAQDHALPPRAVTIPFLANQNNPSDLDFMAAQCDVRGDEMTCRFRQVFLTVSAIDAKSCAITTSGYEQTFHRASATRWVSDGVPEGACGSIETATLDDGGGTRWTLTLRTTATRSAARRRRASRSTTGRTSSVRFPARRFSQGQSKSESGNWVVG